MNSRGEHRAAEPGVRSRTPRTAVLLLALAVAAVGATWGEVHYARSAQVNRADGDNAAVSQEGVQMAGAGSGGTVPDVAALRVNDVLPATVSEPPTPTSTDTYQATRYGGSTSGDCDEALTVGAPTSADTDCTGYLTADYVEQDHSVYTCVTVFFYSGPEAASAAAKGLSALPGPGAVTFQQPSGLPAASVPPTPAALGGTQNGGPASPSTPPSTPPSTVPSVQTRVEAVGSAVDVVESVTATGQPTAGELATPTWFLAYTVGAKLAWQ